MWPRFRTLVRSIMHTLKALIWALLLLFLVAPWLLQVLCAKLVGVGRTWWYQQTQVSDCVLAVATSWFGVVDFNFTLVTLFCKITLPCQMPKMF